MAETIDRRTIVITVDGTDVARDTKKAVQSLSQLERQMESLRRAGIAMRNAAIGGIGVTAVRPAA